MRPIYLVHYDFLWFKQGINARKRESSMQKYYKFISIVFATQKTWEASAKTVQHDTGTKRSQLFENDMLTAALCWLNSSLWNFQGFNRGNGVLTMPHWLTIHRQQSQLRISDKNYLLLIYHLFCFEFNYFFLHTFAQEYSLQQRLVVEWF